MVWKQISFRIFSILIASLLLHTGCRSKDSLFTSLPSSETNISFSNTLEKKPLLNILYYLYYYNGGGVSTGDINNDGLVDIYFAANSKGHNKLYLNKGNFQFEDITEKANVAGTADWCTGVTMADVNSDGYLDIYVSTVSGRYGLAGHNELFINNKNNTFTESSAQYGLNTSSYTTQSAFLIMIVMAIWIVIFLTNRTTPMKTLSTRLTEKNLILCQVTGCIEMI